MKEKPYCCDICEKRFPSYRSMINHKRHHAINKMLNSDNVSIYLPSRYIEAIRSLVETKECNSHREVIEEALAEFLPQAENISKTLGSAELKITCVTLSRDLIERVNTLAYSDKKIYPSKSELIRHAVHCFLVKKLKLEVSPFHESFDNEEVEEKFDEEKYVRIPIEQIDGNGESVLSYETHKILKRLA